MTAVAENTSSSENMLSNRMVNSLHKFRTWDWANSSNDKDGHSQEESFSSGTLMLGNSVHKTVVQFVKLPIVERVPPYTTWIFLDKYVTICVIFLSSLFLAYIGGSGKY
jgi:[histone H3]-lysine27 N-trimethyltransferase EZH2